jgi:hypothetical protein
MQYRTRIGRVAATASTLLAGIALLAGSALANVASAQSSQTDARWQPWLGCWEQAIGAAGLDRADSDHQLLCVVPVEDSPSVELASVDSGRVVARERVTGNGERMTIDEGGCKGWKSAQWSPDGHRLYLKSDYDCGGLRRTPSGIFAMAPGGVWLDVQGESARNGGGVRVVRFRPASAPDDLRDELARATAQRELLLSTARTAAAGDVTTADVIEASRAVDPAVVEAWLVERRPQFAVDSKQLLELANAGVPSRVIDAMVALSYPRVFAIVDSSEVDMHAAEAAQGVDEGQRRTTHSLMMYPFSFGYGSGFGFSPFDYFYSPYGYSGYGSGYGYGWYPGGGPVVIIRNPGQVVPQEHGKVVNGRGYVRGRRSSDNSGSSDQGSVSRRARDSSPSSNRGASTAPAQSGRQSTGRTAKPRNP